MKKLTLLTLLFLAGCGDTVNVDSEALARGSKILDITLTSNFQRYISEFREALATGDVATVSFIGYTDADTTDYVATVEIEGYTQGQWENIVLLQGMDYINGYRIYVFINQWESIKITAKLWSDESNIKTNATLKLSEINIK